MKQGLTFKEKIELIELLMDTYSKIRKSPIPALPLEIAVLKWCTKDNDLNI